jgi:hypothetical protein
MTTYEYGRIAKLAESLENAGVADEIIDQIMEGGEMILKGTDPVKKADWMRDTTGRNLEVAVKSSSLSSSGERPCTFLFTVKDN